MNFGKLYLVPNQLGDFNDNYVLKSHVALINKISFFIFENEKPGRAFIKNISPKKKQTCFHKLTIWCNFLKNHKLDLHKYLTEKTIHSSESNEQNN